MTQNYEKIIHNFAKKIKIEKIEKLNKTNINTT
jgi:hypothetical protein